MEKDEASQSQSQSQSEAPKKFKRKSLIGELLEFVTENKAYVIAPIIIVLLLVGVLILVGGSKAAPFIYTLF